MQTCILDMSFVTGTLHLLSRNIADDSRDDGFWTGVYTVLSTHNCEKEGRFPVSSSTASTMKRDVGDEGTRY
jgi:hypothetical protein